MVFQELVGIQGHSTVLFSGGWDSTYCLLHAYFHDRYPQAVFFDYGQPYANEEREATQAICEYLNMPAQLLLVKSRTLPSDGSGVFYCRNTLLLTLVAIEQPKHIYFGCRNVLPMFDRYKDSNWLYARRLQRSLGRTIKTPCIGRSKRRIIADVSSVVPPELIYSTEKGYERTSNGEY